jgi:hypothetical protein
MGKAIELYMVAIAEDIIAQQKQDDMVATGNSINSHRVTISRDPDQGIHEASEYYTFLAKGGGRAANSKGPPIKILEQWIEDRGISIPAGLSLRQLAYLIQRKIGKVGTAITLGQKGIDIELAVQKHLHPYLEMLGDEQAKEVAQSMIKSFERIPNTKIKTNVTK